MTRHLKNKNVEGATEHKHALEQRQRDEAKQRKEASEKWETKVSFLFFFWGGGGPFRWVAVQPVLA